MLEKPITRAEIAKRFPKWPWAKTTREGTRLQRTLPNGSGTRPGPTTRCLNATWSSKAGAGFCDPVNNRMVEVAAMKFATAQLEVEGYKVWSRESEKVGYNLEAKRRGSVLHVEVKGVSGSLLQFPITVGEVRCEECNPAWHLFVVTGTTSKSPVLHRFTWTEFAAGFVRSPLAFMAKLASSGSPIPPLS